jgi:arginyl-tRNA synthetase
VTFKQEIIGHFKNILLLDDIVLEIPKNSIMGDFSTPVAFSLTKTYKKPPIQIATDLKSHIDKSEIFASCNIIKGFINININSTILNDRVNHIIKDGFIKSEIKKEKILLEYVSANPTGPLHIGHARGAIVGSALCNIGKFLGYDIDSEYYVNDAGNQIQLLGVSLQIAYVETILNNKLDSYPEEYYKGEHIESVVAQIVDEAGEDIFEEENFHSLCMLGKDKMLDIIKGTLESVGIEFDFFVSESNMYQKADDIMGILEKNDALYIQDNKTWLKSSQYGDEKDRVVLKEDSSPTYLAGDIIYHYEKFTKKYDRYINIWGADHHGYINRVKASIDFLGFDSKKLEIILSQMVSLLKDSQPYKMSKRKGNYVTFEDAIEDVGIDALRLTFLSKKCDTHLEFDISQLSKEDASNPIFYINYAHTRIYHLLEKSSFTQDDILQYNLPDEIDSKLRELLISALLLEDVLISAFENREVNRLTDYIYNLSSNVHSFYNQNKIIGDDKELLYLKVLFIVKESINKSLSIIGIEAKTSM